MDREFGTHSIKGDGGGKSNPAKRRKSTENLQGFSFLSFLSLSLSSNDTLIRIVYSSEGLGI